MAVLFLALFFGVVIGFLGFLPQKFVKLTGRLSFAGVVVLIGSMGARIGFDPGLMQSLAMFGWQALVLAITAVLGSLTVVWLLEKLMFKPAAQDAGLRELQEAEVAREANLDNVSQSRVSYALTYLILGSLALGIGAGYWVIPSSAGQLLGVATNWALYLTLWAVGVDLGRSREILGKVLEMGWKVLLAPLGVAVGSIAGAVLGGFILNLPSNEAAAVGAGFGWYSLSGVLLTQIYSVKVGTIAFLSNVFRELIAVITIPALAKRVGPMAAVAPSGATAMDTTLPLVAASAGSHTALVGFVSGFCLSGMVPFLVPLLVKL